MYNSFFDEMQKIAFSLADARKAVGAMKPYLVRRVKKMDVGTGALADVGPITSALKQTKGKSFANVPQGTIFAKGGVAKVPLVKTNVPVVKTVKKPEQKEMLNRIILSHEGLERKAVLKSKQLAYGPNMVGPGKTWQTHMDPSIILRENNMLATMPKGYTPVKETFKQFRDLDATAPLLRKVVPNYTHGQTRFSRHAIKRISQAAERKGLGPYSPTPKAMENVQRAFLKTPDAKSVAQVRQVAEASPNVGIVRRGLRGIKRVFTRDSKTTKLGLGR